MFSQEGVVSTLPNPEAGGPPLVGCPRLLIQFIHSYRPYRRPFLHPQPEDVTCRGDREEALYNILIEFGMPKKLVRLIKMCLTETYSRVRVGKKV
jgi:hypothetical protein